MCVLVSACLTWMKCRQRSEDNSFHSVGPGLVASDFPQSNLKPKVLCWSVFRIVVSETASLIFSSVCLLLVYGKATDFLHANFVAQQFPESVDQL